VKIYSVGGSVRDELLGLPVTDRDYVVVGATPEEMTALGYRPVGRDFPVFLHPQTQEEYALARTERKTARGYHGFEFHAAPEVTLEQDLARRDLTINAIARGDDGTLIDPFNGAADIRARVFRHVGPAFVEDPVRILRVARFAARFDFSIAPETLVLMREMVVRGEVDALVAERVWQELARGLMERHPSRMLDALVACGALAVVLRELAAALAGPALAARQAVLDAAAAAGGDLAQRFALLTMHAGDAALAAFCGRLRVPQECADLALMAARQRDNARHAAALDASALLALLQAVDALRRPARFAQWLAVVGWDDPAAGGACARLRAALAAAAAVDAGAVAKGQADPAGIRDAVAAARTAAIAAALRGPA
jgi:tRNA nucleotidyltransferase (CCA-adding enzyme)